MTAPDPVDVEVGRRIRAKRLRAGMDARTLAHGVRLSVLELLLIERGLAHAGTSLPAIARALCADVGDFFESARAQ